jgi:hypothetical protein
MKYWDGDEWKKQDEDETPPAPVAHHKEVSHKAIVAFVLSLIFPLVGWILGIRASREIRESNGTKTGSPYSTAAIWIGAIGTAIWVFILALTLSMGGHHHGWGDRNEFGNHKMMSGSFSILQNGDDPSGSYGMGMMGGLNSQDPNTQAPYTLDPNGQGLPDQGSAGGSAPGNGGMGMMHRMHVQAGQ